MSVRQAWPPSPNEGERCWSETTKVGVGLLAMLRGSESLGDSPVARLRVGIVRLEGGSHPTLGSEKPGGSFVPLTGADQETE